MGAIVRAICQNDSSGDSKSHRVEVTCDGFFKDLEVDTVNGLYLRKNDEVYVYTANDTWYDALVLGRCNGQLELTELVNVINKIVDILNKDKDVFDKHTHCLNPTAGAQIVSPAGPCVISVPIKLSSANDQTQGMDVGTAPSAFEKADDIKEDDLLHE